MLNAKKHGKAILVAFAANAAGKLKVLGHDGDTLCMQRALISVVEEANKIAF